MECVVPLHRVLLIRKVSTILSFTIIHHEPQWMESFGIQHFTVLNPYEVDKLIIT